MGHFPQTLTFKTGLSANLFSENKFYFRDDKNHFYFNDFALSLAL